MSYNSNMNIKAILASNIGKDVDEVLKRLYPFVCHNTVAIAYNREEDRRYIFEQFRLAGFKVELKFNFASKEHYLHFPHLGVATSQNSKWLRIFQRNDGKLDFEQFYSHKDLIKRLKQTHDYEAFRHLIKDAKEDERLADHVRWIWWHRVWG